MFDTSLMDDLLAMNYSIQHMEFNRAQIYNSLCAVTNVYNETVAYSANHINAQLPAQLVQLLSEIQICNADYNIIQNNIIAQLHANCESLKSKIAVILAKDFLPNTVKLKIIAYIGVHLLENRRKWHIETGSLSAESPEMMHFESVLSILLKIDHESLISERENIEKLVSVIFGMREFELLKNAVSVGLTCYDSKVIASLCAGIYHFPEWASAYNILQSVIVNPSVVTSPDIITNIETLNTTEDVVQVIRSNHMIDVVEEKPQHPKSSIVQPEMKNTEIKPHIITGLVVEPVTRTNIQNEVITDEWKVVVGKRSKKSSNKGEFLKASVKVEVLDVQVALAPAATKVQSVNAQQNAKKTASKDKPKHEPKVISKVIEPAIHVAKNTATVMRNEMQAIIQTLDPDAINQLLNRESSRHDYIHEHIISTISKVGAKIKADFFAKISLPIYICLRIVSDTPALAEHKLLLLHPIFNLVPEELYRLDKSLNILVKVKKLLSDPNLQTDELQEQTKEFTSRLNVLENSANDWFSNHKAEMYSALENTKSGKNVDLHRFNLIMHTTNDLQQTPVMIAIERKLNNRTIYSLLELNVNTLMQRDSKGRNCLDYWAMYDAANLEYVEHMSNLMLGCSDNKNIQKELLSKLYQNCDMDGNSWLHLLIMHNDKQDVVKSALEKMAKFSNKDILFAAAYTKNLQRQSPWYLLEAMPVYRSDIALALVKLIVNSVVTINKLCNKQSPYLFTEDATFFSARRPQSPTDFVANPVFLPINMNDLHRISQVLINRYTLRSNIMDTLKVYARLRKPINGATKPKLTEFQLSIIAYFQCAPDQIELFQVISEEHTLYGYLMQEFCNAKDSELEKITSLPAFKYAEDMLPLNESFIWRKIITHFKCDADVQLTAADIQKIKDYSANSSRQISVVYIGANHDSDAREYTPLELAIMDDCLPLIEFLCEKCDAIVTDEVLLFGFFNAEKYNDMQEYLLSKYSNGLSKDKLNLMAFRIYLQELNTSTFNADKAHWLMAHDLLPTNTNEKGANILHMMIQLLTHDQLRETVLSNFVAFLRAITVNGPAVIQSLMDTPDRSGKGNYLDILEHLHKTKQISDNDRETVMRGVYLVRMEAEARDAALTTSTNDQGKVKLKM